ncbi:MAG: type II toxin-antitoxin system Phd/YefM family antitoxin [Mariprofundaceae bacterium]
MFNISYSDARNGLKSLCDEVHKSHEPALITRKGGDVVLLALSDWESIHETLHLMDIKGSAERISTASDYKGLDSNDVESLKKLIDA